MTYPWFSKKLLRWYDVHGRHDLPWQKNKTAYRVWVSEIMLQQTQVTTVISYYQAFIKQFPSLRQLACAHPDAVLSAWSGLGYYSRARNLHKTAKIINDNHMGRFPITLDDLTALPGIGRSTASAILSIVHGQATAILDGNVRRVLSRVFLLEGHPSKSRVEKAFWQLAQSCMPTTRCADYTQAIMDLGATLCTRGSPHCHICPFKQECLAYQHDLIALYPSKKARKALPVKSTTLLVIHDTQGNVLLEKRPDTGIWGGLWSLPEFDSRQSLEQWLADNATINPHKISEIDSFRHSFSHYHLDITAIALQITSQQFKRTDWQWYSEQSLSTIGTAAPVIKILKHATMLV